jgi:hypothetical protein
VELASDVDRLGQIFSNAVAPSFFLDAIAAFLSLMMLRLADVNGHIKATLVHRPCVSLATSQEQISRSALNLRGIHQDIERTVQQ